MELVLQRKPSRGHSTLGELYADGVFSCFTLEDVVRERPGEPVSAWKVKGETAIPVGRYRVTVTKSARFGRDLPLLNLVPGFEGVRIHTGNTSADTEGCILVGSQIAGEAIVESRAAFQRLFEAIEGELAAGEEVWMEIHGARNGGNA